MAISIERPVKAQSIAQVHGEKLKRPDHVTEQPLGQNSRRVDGTAGTGRTVPPGRAAVRPHTAQATATGSGHKDGEKR
jgi:hypothetical protein